MNSISRLLDIIKKSEPEVRKSFRLVYGTLLMFALVLLTFLIYLLYRENYRVNVLTFASRQRMYSQKIALDVTMHAENETTKDTKLIESDLQKMEYNSHKLKKHLVKTGQYELYEKTFIKTEAYFRDIKKYIETKNHEDAAKIRLQTQELYPDFESILNALLDEVKDYFRGVIILMVVFLLGSSFIFFLVTVYKVIPYVKKYNQNHKDIIDNQYKLKVATESASLGVFKHDAGTNKLEWDSQMYHIYEVDETTEGINYDKWYSFLYDESKEEAKSQLTESLDSNKTFHYEFKIKTAKGNEKWISTSGVAIRNIDGNIEVIGVNSDVTQLKYIESELVRSKESALRANEAKSEFLANMSHEIRTPLHGIIGVANMIAETPLSPKQRDYVNRMILSSHLLIQIVNDILDFSKIEANRLYIANEEFDLNDAFDKLYNMFGYIAYTKKVELSFYIDPNIPQQLVGDELRITQILMNLLGNAIKFTEKGQVRVYAECLHRDKPEALLEFKIIDTGIGMSKEKQSKLFTEFEQGDNTTSKRYGGTGLGLVICQKLIQLMGGNICFESTEGLGSEFRFWIPLVEAPESSIAPNEHKEHKEQQPWKIVIVSSGNEQVDYLTQLLEWKKCDVVRINPETKDELAHTEEANRIVLDWKSYRSDNCTFHRILEEDKLRKKTVFLMTEFAKTELEHLLSQSNRQDLEIIRLPFTPADVYSVIYNKNPKSLHSHDKKQLALTEKKTCLIVEDNETNQMIAANLLEKIGFDVDCAENGFLAVDKATSTHYDVIFMDIHMPVMDGYEATRKIRKIDPNIPIVGLTASVLEKDKKDSSNAGFNFHIGKPIDLQELYSVVSHYFDTTYLEKSKDTPEGSAITEPKRQLNMAYLNDMFPNKEFINRLLDSFLEIYDDIETDWLETDPDSEDAQIKIHTLKGVVGNLRINSLYELTQTFAMQTESVARREIFHQIIQQVITLNHEIREELQKA